MYLDPTDGRIIECKDHSVDQDGRERLRITDYTGKVLDSSTVQ
jgi:hypothetical protein